VILSNMGECSSSYCSTMARFTPVATPGSSKYGDRSKCFSRLLSDFDISDNAKRVLEIAGDYSLAKSTWNTYETAERMLMRCCKDTGRSLEYPMSNSDILEFVGWLLHTRGVKAKTVDSYLAGVRQLHILRGMEPPKIRTDLVKFILRGQQNKDNIQDRKVLNRLPMTIAVMKLLKNSISEGEMNLERKLLIWAVATLAFHGGFRIHELLCKQECSFDPDFTLLTEDVQLSKSTGEQVPMLVVTLKCPKEDRTGRAVAVEVYQTGGQLCPVRAFLKWQRKTTSQRGQPLFRDETGTPFTGAKLNKSLKERLMSYISYGGKFTSHSFRIGLASTLAQQGLSDTEVAEAGRWSSRAFELYMKLPRVKRAGTARKISSIEDR